MNLSVNNNSQYKQILYKNSYSINPNCKHNNYVNFKAKLLGSNGDNFNKVYYEDGIKTHLSGYQNYHWMPEKTVPMCKAIIEELGITKKDKILDFGCAKGYLVKAFRMLGFKSHGFDISDYAINSAPDDVKKYLSTSLKGSYDYIIAKDVFEHVKYEDISKLLKKLHKMCNNLFCVVPLGENGKYIIPTCNEDKTHIIKESLDWWKNIFQKSGFGVQKASYKVKGISEQHVNWENGIGFFILKSMK